MPKLTVLDMVQDILNDMDGDDVNSISDTVESMQVAQVIKTTYYEILSSRNWSHLSGLLTLTASGDNEQPTHMLIPEDVAKIEWIKYNVRDIDDTKDKYEKVVYKEPEEFINILDARDSSASNILTVENPANIKLFIKTDSKPMYWTSFDDEYIVFDSYDSDVDDTLQTSKVQVWGSKEPSFSLLDSFIPDLPTRAFSYLLSEAKSSCFNSLRQSANPKEEQKSRRQRIWLARNARRDGQSDSKPNYGRK